MANEDNRIVLLLTRSDDGDPLPWVFESVAEADAAQRIFERHRIYPARYDSELVNAPEEVLHAIQEWKRCGTLTAIRSFNTEIERYPT